jgi:5'-3' exoribonuclease 1
LSERYPLLNMSVTATEAPPDIDNLYLDMNGIIHNCTHANDPNLKLTENEMIVRIFTYLDKLIQIIKPQQLVFMAIDGEGHPLAAGWQPLAAARAPVLTWHIGLLAGVAPRAKMNQQRARRFKSAQERIAVSCCCGAAAAPPVPGPACMQQRAAFRNMQHPL